MWGHWLFPSLHFCPEFDFLLIDRNSPEAHGCSCRDAYGERVCEPDESRV